MELKDPFGIADRLLGPDTAQGIWERCNELLATEAFRARGLMEHFRVRVVCTTDDPTDDLDQHRLLADAWKRREFGVKVLPAFRPDRAMAVEYPAAFNQWLRRLEQAAGAEIRDYRGFLEALQARHRYFHQMGCRLSDHGIEQPYAEACSERLLAACFRKLRAGRPLDPGETLRFKSAVLHELAVLDAEAGWSQQLHLGALRNNSSRMLAALGPDTGFDAMGDFELGRPLAAFLDRLDREGRLARTILFALNPRDNEMLASIAGSFQDGSARGKVQLGAAWWFNDQLEGMTRQLEALSNIGLLATFVGMLTDSRSFLSYPRHEYFRRLLCNLIGSEVEAGLLPADLPLLGGILRDVCWNNAAQYFQIEGIEA
jgi:glucuronate isomerase